MTNIPDSAVIPSIKLLTPHIGAVVDGIALSPDMGEGVIDAINGVLAENLLVILPNQNLSAITLRDVVKRFGCLFVHHVDDGVIFADGIPEVLEMRKEADGTCLFGGADWHADITFRKPAGHLSFLYAQILPPVGGDTGFANTITSFNSLSNGMKDLLRGLKGVHSYNGPGRAEHPEQTAIHPAVRRHPETGQEGLFINRMFTTRFDGMTEEESAPILKYLDRFMSRPEFTCRVRWFPGQVIIWDNRFTLHYPINDFTGAQRMLLRCSTVES